jgi:hypothetical protein
MVSAAGSPSRTAIKQLANKAASGNKRAIQDMLRFQTMLFPDAPMTSSEPGNGKAPTSPGRRPPFTIMPLTSKPRGGTVPFITAGALIVLGTALFFVFAG